MTLSLSLTIIVLLTLRSLICNSSYETAPGTACDDDDDDDNDDEYDDDKDSNEHQSELDVSTISNNDERSTSGYVRQSST
jgi:hypothetical protein